MKPETGSRKRPFQPEEHKNVLRAVHALERLFLGPLTPTVRTPHRIAFMWEKGDLIHYQSRKRPRFHTPLLIVPPLMVTPTIFDLRPGHSFVEHLVDRGFDVFLIDFGVPTDEDVTQTISDYVLEILPDAAEKVCELTGRNEISMLGWSMGGIFIDIYSALVGKDGPVKNIVTLGSPIDFSALFPFNIMAKLAEWPLMKVIDRIGNIPPALTRNGFKLLKPIGQVKRYINLAVHLWDREWVAGFETIDRWVDDFIPYPGATFKEFLSNYVIDDKLRRGEIVLGERRVDLKAIECSFCIVSGLADKVAALQSVEGIADMVSSADIEIIQAPVGHIGLIAGSKAQKTVWAPVADWLEARSRKVS